MSRKKKKKRQPEQEQQNPDEKRSEDLKLIRIFDFRLIPRYLFEQAQRGGSWEIDELYGDWGQTVANNPLSMLFAMADGSYHTKGVLWAVVAPLERAISVQVLSIDKIYQDRKAVQHAHDFLMNTKEKLNLRKIRFCTTRPKAFERYGYHRSNRIMMEV